MSRKYLRIAGWMIPVIVVVLALGYAKWSRQRTDAKMEYVDAAGFAEVRGNLDEAEELYRKALRIDRRFLPARSGLANMYATHGQPTKALDLMREGARIDRRNPEAHRALADVCVQTGRHPEAIECLHRALKLEPDDYYTRLTLMYTYRWNGDYEAALRELDELDKVRPGDPVLRRARKATELQQQEAKQAKAATAKPTGRGTTAADESAGKER